MAICINCDGIYFRNFSIKCDADGLCIDGQFSHQGISQFQNNQGSVSGFTAGGVAPPVDPDSGVNNIQSFPFTSDAPATDIADLIQARRGVVGVSSTTHGYSIGGFTGNAFTNTIDKFNFVNGENATDVGEVVFTQPDGAPRPNYSGGASFQSATDGIVSNGFSGPGASEFADTRYSTVYSFPFAADVSTTDTGVDTHQSAGVSGTSSSTHAYILGGECSNLDTLGKFPFILNASFSDIAELDKCRSTTNGSQSSESGYHTGGTDRGVPTTVDEIIKYPFSSDTTNSLVGSLSTPRNGMSNQTSTVSGYSSGGCEPTTPARVDTIEKFPFSSDTNASDVGELIFAQNGAAGHHV